MYGSQEATKGNKRHKARGRRAPAPHLQDGLVVAPGRARLHDLDLRGAILQRQSTAFFEDCIPVDNSAWRIVCAAGSI